MTCDYVLYDNKTLGRDGQYDWAVKKATGALNGDRKSLGEFVKYCRRAGHPQGFDAALGGIVLSGDRYLLCVTLEAEDSHERRACAFVGIYCPRRDDLKSLLTRGDPLRSANGVCEGTPPAQLVVEGRPLGGSAGGRPARGLHVFRPDSSPDRVAALLLRRIENNEQLPSILGITSWRADRRVVFAEYDFVFCLGLPEDMAAGLDDSSSKDPGDRPAKDRGIMVYAAVCFAIALAAWLFLKLYSFPFQRVDRDVETRVESVTVPDSPSRVQHESEPTRTNEDRKDDPQDFLTHFSTLLDRVHAIHPDQLLATPEYRALKEVVVLQQYRGKQKAMLDLLTVDLPGFKDAVEKVNFRFYYEAAQMKSMNPAQRAAEIRNGLSPIRLPTDGCRLLRSEFALWAERPNSVTGEACDLADALATQSR